MRRILLTIVILLATFISPSSQALAQTAKAGAPTKAVPAKNSKSKAGKSTAAKASKATAASPVNINSSSVSQLQTLPGIGASTAQRIVDYRQKNGSFKKIEELMNVQGIGEKSFLKLKPLVTVSGDKGERAGGEK